MKTFEKLNFPESSLKLKYENLKPFVFDNIRKKWLLLTPEEWVRQHLINYLINHKNYPVNFISIEKELILNNIKKRYDVVIYNKQLIPKILIECKAPYIELNTGVIEQALRYNLVLKANYVMITNGVSDLIFNNLNQTLPLPEYSEINTE